MYHEINTPRSTTDCVLRGSTIGMLQSGRGYSSQAVVVNLSVQALTPSEMMSTPIQSGAVPQVASIVAGGCAVCSCWVSLERNHI